MNRIFSIFIVILICSQSYGQKPRARDLGVPFVGRTGEFNAITDVKGVEVGYSTIISGEGKNIIGKVPLELVLLQFFREEKPKNSVQYMPTGTV
ncbi:hypothetical protein [Thalassobellus suaedae]|uniref:Aminopeptidase n=1 Tax=Thalassobellus suaedae TaxID=3074124 RepID=A0ABY9XT25_9FLAO|nr:hypothetical protein RHP51_17380 [Flavobacteriaceae bacterium HL-DH14]